MKNFKEWLSDYLRYFMLILAAVLVVVIVLIGIGAVRRSKQPHTKDAIEIITEQEEETKETEERQTESETEKKTKEETEKKSESETDPKTDSETNPAGKTEAQADGETLSGMRGEQDPEAVNEPTAERQTETKQTETAQTEQTQTEEVQTDVPQTEAPPQTEPEPVYLSLNHACNLRSGPGYDYDVITSYTAGTVVEFRGMVEGWAEVQIDGMIGYMGRQFLG